jgi:hypothetical protein
MSKIEELEGEGWSIDRLYPQGWILYCPACLDYIKQSDPQNFSGRKSVVLDGEPCAKCIKGRDDEIQEAQAVLGRLGLPQGDSNENKV